MSRPIEELTAESKFTLCEEALQYKFRDRALLELALTHASVSRTRIESNERLEFLGDAILGGIICETLYHRFPESPEGELTRIKSSLVSRTTCAVVADQIGLQRLFDPGQGSADASADPVVDSGGRVRVGGGGGVSRRRT